jgi:type II secretory pathway pseudopilin PulG
MKMASFNIKINHQGQALIEVLIGLFIVGILVGAATTAVIVALRSNVESKNFQAASALSQKMLDDVKTVAEGDWHDIYNLTDKNPSSPDNKYYLAASGTALAVFPGATTTIIGNITYTRFFSIEDVKRFNGSISSEPLAIDDPSTQKIVGHTQWLSAGQTSEAALTGYLTRWRNLISQQTDWSGGPGQEGPLSEFNQKFVSSTGIDFSSSTGSIIIQF